MSPARPLDGRAGRRAFPISTPRPSTIDPSASVSASRSPATEASTTVRPVLVSAAMTDTENLPSSDDARTVHAAPDDSRSATYCCCMISPSCARVSGVGQEPCGRPPTVRVRRPQAAAGAASSAGGEDLARVGRDPDGGDPADPPIAFECSSPELIGSLATRGLGVAVLPEPLAAIVGLVAVPLVRPSARSRISLVWRRGGPTTPAARAFLAVMGSGSPTSGGGTRHRRGGGR